MNGLWKALLTGSTSIINEGKGEVFVKAFFLLGSPSRLFWSMSRMNQESEKFRATKILCSIYHLQWLQEVGDKTIWRVSDFLGDSKELLLWPRRLFLVDEKETKL
jgi:hypothetical protein